MGAKHTKVPLSSIKALTLHDGRLTTHRRGKAVPQLSCTGKLCGYAPDVVQCTNVGDDGTGSQWKCDADLPSGIKFGNLEVVCEGWARAGDTNVLAGSCALDYELVPADNRAWPGRSDNNNWFKSSTSGNNKPSATDFLFNLLFYGVFAFMLYKILKAAYAAFRAAPRPWSSGRGNGGGWWPGGGGGGWWPGGWGPGGGGGPYSSGWGGPPPPYTKTTDASTPGFWTGVATGALGSALFNSPRREPEVVYVRTPTAPVQQARNNTPRWDDEPGPSRRATGYGGSRTR